MRILGGGRFFLAFCSNVRLSPPSDATSAPADSGTSPSSPAISAATAPFLPFLSFLSFLPFFFFPARLPSSSLSPNRPSRPLTPKASSSPRSRSSSTPPFFFLPLVCFPSAIFCIFLAFCFCFHSGSSSSTTSFALSDAPATASTSAASDVSDTEAVDSSVKSAIPKSSSRLCLAFFLLIFGGGETGGANAAPSTLSSGASIAASRSPFLAFFFFFFFSFFITTGAANAGLSTGASAASNCSRAASAACWAAESFFLAIITTPPIPTPFLPSRSLATTPFPPEKEERPEQSACWGRSARGWLKAVTADSRTIRQTPARSAIEAVRFPNPALLDILFLFRQPLGHLLSLAGRFWASASYKSCSKIFSMSSGTGTLCIDRARMQRQYTADKRS
mmetsp:Transcript_4903/g.11417  ORF Transcript_4903/g.11417 Transcript_4903/m.11417 type:complete len:391 (+) Transcript_4903:1894-3066(+)